LTTSSRRIAPLRAVIERSATLLPARAGDQRPRAFDDTFDLRAVERPRQRCALR
jgi:hypothetical protein